MPENLENSAVATGLEKSVFISIPKKGNAKECSDYRTIAFISHASKIILKILQVRLQQHVNQEVLDVQAGFRKGRGTRDQIANILWITVKARGFQKNPSTSALLSMLKTLTVWITTNCGKFLEMGIPDHPTCLLRNLYSGQEATVTTGCVTTNWFRIGKGVRHGYILSP